MLNTRLKIVIIDVGHGGSDCGAAANGILEKDANLTTALSLRSFLEANGVKVFITRTNDVFLTLEARTSIANNIMAQYPNADIVFISLHHNAGGGDRGEYIHSIYRGKGLALATSIANEMETRLGQQQKVFEKAGEDNKDYYFVIRNTNMDAVIVEVCFLDNPIDVQIADTKAEQVRNGQVIGSGVLKYFGINTNTLKPIITPKPTTTLDVYYKVFTAAHGWLPEVKNLEDYAGILGEPILAVECRVVGNKSIIYRTSNVNCDYYPQVVNNTDYAGDKVNPIDRFQIMNTAFRYRVHVLNGSWLSWIEGTSDTGGSGDNFAGIIGIPIDGISIEPIKLIGTQPVNPITTI